MAPALNPSRTLLEAPSSKADLSVPESNPNVPPALDGIRYATNFIAAVIARVDFAPILSIAQTPVALFQEDVRLILPEYGTNTITEIESTLSRVDGVPSLDNKRVDLVTHVFKSEAGDCSLTLCQKYLSVECSRYTTYEDFKEIVTTAIDALKRRYGSPTIQRLGLRYVNQIRPGNGDPFDWKGLVDSTLTHFLDSVVDDKSKLARAITRAVYAEDDYSLAVTYGFFNREYPAKIASREFYLDFDCFTSESQPQEILPNFDRFHERIQELFEKCSGDGLRAIMNQQ